MSRGSQRWLRTALHVISDTETGPDREEQLRRVIDEDREAGPPRVQPGARPASLEDVVSGKADLREHLDAYPELSDELEGLAGIIDMLREAGEARRRRGEQIFREEILGQLERQMEEDENGELT